MTTVKAHRPFLNINQAVEYLQSLGFESCTADTIRYLAYEKGALPRPKVVGRHAYWSRADLDRYVENL